jgi:hypothetical protein
MSPKRYIARSRAIAARTLGDETMVMSAASSTLFTLDQVATLIWEAADGVTPLDQIVTDKVCKQYDVTPDVALRDANALVEQLAEQGLLLLSDQPITEPGKLAAGSR